MEQNIVKAADLAEKSIWDFMDFLKAHDIPWSSYSEEEMQMDELAIANLSDNSSASPLRQSSLYSSSSQSAISWTSIPS